MDLSTFYCENDLFDPAADRVNSDSGLLDYHWWKNPYWGTPEETVAKVKDLYGSGRPYHAPPMPGASENVARLRAMGFHLVIVTAREKREMDATMRWLDEHFPSAYGLSRAVL